MVNYCNYWNCTKEARPGEATCEKHAVGPRLTADNLRVLGWIETFMARNPYAPTIQEIGDGCGLKSKNTVAYHLARLEANGKIARLEFKPRGIVLKTQTAGG